MQDIIQQVRAVNGADLYYVSLFSALALPDICAALEAADGQASKAKYVAWFDTHVAPRYNGFLDGETSYYFRCSMLHQGSTRHPRGRYSRVIFVEPGHSGMVLHNNVINDALNIDVRIFCEDLCQAAEQWWQGAASEANVQTNLARFVTRHPTGLAPYIGGVPVIG
ncbi:MAG: hypothetical protein KFB92_14375 [Alcanivorax sp.]|nr:MAG: hypothetical protein KFB92_14375 [Alcanivorax sp.]